MVRKRTLHSTGVWLGQFPKLREWVGDRVVKDMKAQAYQVQNKLYEGTVGVKRTDLEDDNVGVYTPLFAEMGRAARSHADELVFALLAAGETATGYDGKPFFSATHPVYPNVDGTGTAVNVSNLGEGTGDAWYLLDTSRALKPLIFQERTQPELDTLTDRNDEGVFVRDEYRYGVRYRCNAGLGFWQMAYKSRAVLDAAGFGHEAVMAMPWVEARDFLEAVGRIERERLLNAAVAARAAQADEKGWKAWVASISR